MIPAIAGDAPPLMSVSHRRAWRSLCSKRAHMADKIASQGWRAGSNASDDREVAALEGGADNATGAELRAATASLSEDQRAALVALVWIGRGDF